VHGLLLSYRFIWNIILPLFLVYGSTLICSASPNISESYLLDAAKATGARREMIEANLSKSSANKFEVMTEYDAKFNLASEYTKNRQDLVPNQFLAEKNRSIAATISKKTKYGIDIEGGVAYRHLAIGNYATSLQNGQLSNYLYTPQAYLNLSLSLYNNLLGKLDRAYLGIASIQENISELNSTLARKRFYLEVLSKYWEILQHKQQLFINASLLKSAKKQLSIVKLRHSKSVADKSDIARSQSLVAQRELDAGELKNIGVLLAQDLGNLIGSHHQDYIQAWLHKPLSPEEKELIKSRNQIVYSCSKKVMVSLEPRMDETSLKQVRNHILELQRLELKAVDKGSPYDLSLNTQLVGNGVRNNNKDAFDDALDIDKTNYTISLNLVVPLGSSKSRSTHFKKQTITHNYTAQLIELDNSILNANRAIIQAIKQNQNNLKFVNTSVSELEKRLTEQNKKFLVGRVDLFDLVQEEERVTSLKNKRLLLEFRAIQNLFNYLALFDKWSCTELPY